MQNYTLNLNTTQCSVTVLYFPDTEFKVWKMHFPAVWTTALVHVTFKRFQLLEQFI